MAPEGRRGKSPLVEIHTVKEFFFFTLIFYLHIANTQNYLEEIASYDEPLQNPQKENKREKKRCLSFRIGPGFYVGM